MSQIPICPYCDQPVRINMDGKRRKHFHATRISYVSGKEKRHPGKRCYGSEKRA